MTNTQVKDLPVKIESKIEEFEVQEIKVPKTKPVKVALTKEEKELRKQEKKTQELEQNLVDLEALEAQLFEIKQKIKKLQKRNRKLKPKNTSTKSGIVKPMSITKELAEYLGVEHDVKLARSTISSLLNQVFEKKGIKDGNTIHADKDPETKKLFPKGGKEYPIDSKNPTVFGLSWRNIQKNIKHFIVPDIVEPKEPVEPKDSKVTSVKKTVPKEPKEPKESKTKKVVKKVKA